jgi:hypothetical protein
VHTQARTGAERDEIGRKVREQLGSSLAIALCLKKRSCQPHDRVARSHAFCLLPWRRARADRELAHPSRL